MPNIITGTPGNDTLNGTPGDDSIDAGAGNDTVNGSGGYDIVHGGDGDDVLVGSLHGELYGDAGNDRLIFYAADGSVDHPYTTADGGSGYDTAEVRFSNFGSGLVYTHDTTYAEIHCGRIAGILVGIEAIIFNGSFADDQITGGPNADEIWGGLGNDMVAGGGGDDIVGGQGGDDRVFGNDGNDTLVLGTSGNDSFDGGAGIDTLNLSLDRSTASGVAVDLGLASQVIEGRTITLANIENLSGTNYADTLKGSAGDNVIFSYAGADVLSGNGGNDLFFDTAAQHNGDTITDFNAGDRIIVTDGSAANFSASLSGNTLTYSGGTMTLSGSFTGLQIVAKAYAGGGVELSLAGAHVRCEKRLQRRWAERRPVAQRRRRTRKLDQQRGGRAGLQCRGRNRAGLERLARGRHGRLQR